MPRPQRIDETALLERLSRVFRNRGYEGATMAELARAAGLQKASLYHRFPGGKEQMAMEVMAFVGDLVAGSILRPLLDPTLARSRKIQLLLEGLDKLYGGGRESCLLNLLAHPTGDKGPFSDAISETFDALTQAIAGILEDLPREEALRRARTALMLLHGGLVLSRGTRDTAPFRQALALIEETLL